jgi:peroxiredoxin
MKKHYALTLILALSFIIAAIPNGRAKTVSVRAGVADAEIGSTVADFKLPDVRSGKEQSLASLKGKNGTVLIFISVQCPVSNAYNERMEKLAQDYKAKGINVVGINSNATESSDEVKSHAASHNLTFPILKDPGNKIADIFGAEHTPEAFLLDAGNKLVYRGRIDNSRSGATISANDLRDAMDATLAGKPVAKSRVDAFGCSIKKVSD